MKNLFVLLTLVLLIFTSCTTEVDEREIIYPKADLGKTEASESIDHLVAFSKTETEKVLKEIDEKTKEIEKITISEMEKHDIEFNACVEKYGKEYADNITKQKEEVANQLSELITYKIDLMRAILNNKHMSKIMGTKLDNTIYERELKSNQANIDYLEKKIKKISYV